MSLIASPGADAVAPGIKEPCAESEWSKAPAIIRDARGRLLFCFSDGRILVAKATSEAPSTPASSQ